MTARPLSRSNIVCPHAQTCYRPLTTCHCVRNLMLRPPREVAKARQEVAALSACSRPDGAASHQATRPTASNVAEAQMPVQSPCNDQQSTWPLPPWAPHSPLASAGSRHPALRAAHHHGRCRRRKLLLFGSLPPSIGVVPAHRNATCTVRRCSTRPRIPKRGID